MPTYNLTSLANNTTGFVSLTQNVNNHLVGGLLFLFILIALAAIFWISFLKSTGDARKAFVGTGFLSMTFAILFRAMNLLTNEIMFIVIIASAISIALTWNPNS